MKNRTNTTNCQNPVPTVISLPYFFMIFYTAILQKSYLTQSFLLISHSWYTGLVIITEASYTKG